MRVLVLHNSNIPDFLMLDKKDNDIFITSKSVTLPETDIPDFDVFISNKLADRNEADIINKKYDIIVLPYNTTDNYLEYSGLRIAAHIRLTKQWQSLSTPILFIGPDSFEEINQFSELAPILSSFNIYTTSSNTEDEIFAKLRWIDQITETTDNIEERPEYKDFLKRMNCLSAPANYGTHHSIANEWAILRWTQMFDWKGNAPSINIDHFKYMLYFKWLMAKMGARDEFKKKKLQNPIIPNLPPKSRILYIDDEGDKGWNNLLGALVHNSGSKLIPFEGFKKGLSKEELINNIEKFIEKTPAHCYLIDLRLHDDDFSSNSNLSGLIIADDLLKTNRGKQIIILTASNKSWNYEAAIKKIGDNKGVLGYVVKESPEYNYSVEETYENFSKLSRLLVEACKNSFIADYVDQLNKFRKFDILENFVDMLCLNKDKTIRTNALNMNVFIEDYIVAKKEKYRQINEKPRNGSFELDPDIKPRLIRYVNNQRVNVGNYNRDEIFFSKDFSSVEFVSTTFKPIDKIKMDDKSSGDVALITIVLHDYYKFSKDICNKVLKLKSIRNKAIAHHPGKLNISLNELCDIFENVVLKILERDTKDGYL